MLLLLAAAASAHESEPQHFVLEDTVEFYTGSEMDSGWLPADSPLAVKFAVVADGGAWVRMEGDGTLTWPEALTLGFAGEAGTGEIVQEASLSAVTSILFDVGGYSWEGEIDRRGVTIEAEGVFDPFLLSGADPETVDLDFSGTPDEVISYEYDVFTGVSVVFAADLHAEATTSFRGLSWTDEDATIEAEGETALIDPTGDPTQEETCTYEGEFTNALSLVLTPTFSVCVDFVGCWDLLSFDIPLTLAEEVLAHAFPPATLGFPLPVTASDVEAHDFGAVDVGEIANLEVPVGNLGDLYLEGFTGLLGSEYFSIYPEYIYAGPGNEDGLVVTFGPESAGEFRATLVIESNDPLDPVHEIELVGTGVAEESDTGEPEVQVIESEIKGCGCGAVGRPAGGWLLLLGACLVRRRRAP